MNMNPKPRKHKFVTECIKSGHSTMTVWPSEGEALNIFEDKLEKVKNDPRVVDVEAVEHIANGYKLTINANES